VHLFLLLLLLFSDTHSPNAVFEFAGDREALGDEEDLKELEIKEKEQVK